MHRLHFLANGKFLFSFSFLCVCVYAADVADIPTLVIQPQPAVSLATYGGWPCVHKAVFLDRAVAHFDLPYTLRPQ